MTTPPGRSEVWATYRVQLHRGFTFTDLAHITGYLSDLGVTHAYCSPSLQAAAGSTHGYDVVDPNRLNVELGGIEAYAALVDQLHSHGLGQVLDIVPNHMALDGRDNRWWWDVLANGPSSPYASYFDIDWDPPERKLMGSVLVPILGEQYGRVLDAGQIRVERSGGSFEVHYGDHTLPVSPRSINELLARAASQVSSEELAAMAIAFGELPHAIIRDPVLAAERQRGSRILELRLRRLVEKQPDVAAAIDAELKEINDDPDELHQLLERQNYRLAFWRTASEELDYRRFFNIETLVGLRVEDPQVFADTHGLIGSLVAGGLVNGLRVDHIDGLRDPEGYLVRLSQATGAIWVVVEKILAPDEELPETWPVAGTTGYEFLNRVNGLFVASDNMAALTEGYDAFIGFAFDYPELVHDSKMQIMDEELAAEVERLTGAWALVSERHRCYRDYTRRELREALREVLACFPVYRTYLRPGAPVREADCRVIDQAITEACRRRPDLDADLLGFLGDLLRLEYPGEREEDLVARFQQLSGPVMAKGVEDTVFYRYNRLISLNEVGRKPRRRRRGAWSVPRRVPADGRALAPHLVDPGDARHQTGTRHPVADQRAVGDPGAVARRHRPLVGPQRPIPPGQRGRVARSQRRVPAVPDPGGGMADRGRPGAGLHGEGDQGGQGPYLLGVARRRLRRGGALLCDLGTGGRVVRRRPRAFLGRAAHRRSGAGQLVGPDGPPFHLPWLCRPLPGDRAVGSQPGRP